MNLDKLDAAPTATRCYLSTAPNQWGCHDPQCDDSTWDNECPVGPCTVDHSGEAGERSDTPTAVDLPEVTG